MCKFSYISYVFSSLRLSLFYFYFFVRLSNFLIIYFTCGGLVMILSWNSQEIFREGGGDKNGTPEDGDFVWWSCISLINIKKPVVLTECVYPTYHRPLGVPATSRWETRGRGAETRYQSRRYGRQPSQKWWCDGGPPRLLSSFRPWSTISGKCMVSTRDLFLWHYLLIPRHIKTKRWLYKSP